tara:strand:- start:21665 stop:21781 length:117 start_codon:yes stop_codon:yes gene_type:complete
MAHPQSFPKGRKPDGKNKYNLKLPKKSPFLRKGLGTGI